MREVSCRNEPSGAYTVLHAVPSINTRALYANALNSIAKRESRGSKTLWQVQGSALPESRGRASGVSLSPSRTCTQHRAAS